jgi:septal ring factor EnvC (AmiA/AmiB activator)
MPPVPNQRRTSDPEPGPEVATPVVAEADSEPERRRISDYLGDVSRLEAELATERKQNEELRAEVLYQRRRIEREEEARLQLMQLLDNSQRLLGNAQRHTQHLLGGNEAEIFTMNLAEAAGPAAEEAPTAEAAAPPQPKPRRRWWSRG